MQRNKSNRELQPGTQLISVTPDRKFTLNPLHCGASRSEVVLWAQDTEGANSCFLQNEPAVINAAHARRRQIPVTFDEEERTGKKYA